MKRKTIEAIVRHIATFGGGVLVALGLSDQDTAELISKNTDAIMGGVVSIVGIVASILNKRTQQKLEDGAK